MTIKAAHPYLILNGKAEQAIELYQSALGATVEALQRFGDVDSSCPAAMKNHVMHAQLRVGEALLMLSDGAPQEGVQPAASNVNVALDLDDPDQARRCFDALAASGQVFQPLIEAPWGALFGSLSDPFGIQWMFNSAKTK